VPTGKIQTPFDRSPQFDLSASIPTEGRRGVIPNPDPPASRRACVTHAMFGGNTERNAAETRADYSDTPDLVDRIPAITEKRPVIGAFFNLDPPPL